MRIIQAVAFAVSLAGVGTAGYFTGQAAVAVATCSAPAPAPAPQRVTPHFDMMPMTGNKGF